MILCLESTLLGGYLSNEVPGLVTGCLHLAGLKDALPVELSGNFLRDIAGCRVDFHNPLPEAELDHVAQIAMPQTGFAGVMTASFRVARLPRRRMAAAGRDLPSPPGLKNLLYFEWFNRQSQRILIQSWSLNLRVGAPQWQLSAEDEARLLRQSRARRKHFLLSQRGGEGHNALHAPGMADPFEPETNPANPFGTPFEEPRAQAPGPGSLAEIDSPTERATALARELHRFEHLLTAGGEVRTRPAVVRLLGAVTDLSAHLIQSLRKFSAAEPARWRRLVEDLEQSLPTFDAALNATDRLTTRAKPGMDQPWLANLQASLLNIQLRMRELLMMLK